MGRQENIRIFEDTKYYSVELIDYSTPGFVSATVTYYGTKEDIMQVLDRIEEERPDLKRAAEEYFSGQGEGIVRVELGAPEPLIRPMKFLGETTGEYAPFSQTYWNTWNCDYHLVADNVSYRLVYLENSEGEIVRCVKARFAKLCIRDDDRGDRDMTKYRFWGHPGMIQGSQENKTGDTWQVYNTLMFCDKRFDSLVEAKADMKHPAEINYKRFFADIFGDG